MKLLKDSYKRFLSLFNYPYIEKELLNDMKGPLLLHISDTPVDIYNYILRIINIIKPQYIIHTGDMADDIKLEIYKNRIDDYNKGIKKLIKILEEDELSKIYYVLGNHDNYEAVSKLTKRGEILYEGVLSIEDCNIAVNHYHKEYSNKVDFNLYGHSFDPNHYVKNGTIGLNGTLNINIIDLSNKKVFQIEYPMNTNVSRRMELRKIGL